MQQPETGLTVAQYQPTQRVDGTSTIVLQAITAMQRYEQKSFEELRLEDYMAGNKGTQGQQQHSNEKTETIKVLPVIRSIFDKAEADESQMHDENALELLEEEIVLPWVYNVHGGFVDEALKALKAISSEIEDDALMKAIALLTSWEMNMNGKVMQVIFVEKDANVARFSFSNDIFKYQVERYALNRGVSLKSLRFSYKETPLFVSSLGRKTTLAELGIQDLDEIVVDDTRVSNDSNKENVVNNPVQLHKGKTKKKKNNQTKKVKKQPIQRLEPIMTSKDYKAQHSFAFTKVLEELRPRLKEIRMGLNALDLQCQPKKMKNIAGKKNTIQEAVNHSLPGPEIGGKAGKSHFVVQVGEVQNLYKTTKASSTSPLNVSQGGVPTLDLHGCTKEDAIVKLNESLEVWFDIAMTGSYPFVITAVIVCGCGSQVLSETVQDWIKSTSRVRNAPKNRTLRKL
jgi:hypothetical protein